MTCKHFSTDPRKKTGCTLEDLSIGFNFDTMQSEHVRMDLRSLSWTNAEYMNLIVRFLDHRLNCCLPDALINISH